jgi:hypothetical protein
MDDAGDQIFVGGFDGDDVAVVPLGDDGFLDGVAVAAEDFVKLVLDLVAGAAHFFADACEFGVGSIGDFAAIVDTAVDFLFDFGVGAEFFD